MRGKKGSEMFGIDYTVWAIVLTLILGVVGIFFMILVGKTGSEQAVLGTSLEAFVLKQRFYKSQECFVSSESLRGVIDAAKFNDQNLNKCYTIADKTMPAFKLTLNTDAINNFQIKTQNWDENKQFQEKESKQVLVQSKGEIKIGELTIEIQNLQ